MCRLRFFAYLLLPLFALTLFCLKFAPAQQTPPAKQTPPAQPTTPPVKPAPPSPPAPKADPKAEKTIVMAIEAQEPRQLGGVTMDLWQKLTLGDLTVTAEGAYSVGRQQQTDKQGKPAILHLIRQEMRLDLAGCKGELLTVCDGTTVWHSIQVGKRPRVVSKWDMKKIQAALGAIGTMPQVEEGFFVGHGFAGLVPLLKGLQAQLTFTQQEAETWEDHAGKQHKVFKVTGVWGPEISKYFATASKGWPPLAPRLCTFFIDQEKPYWSYRLEFWGSDGRSKTETILFQMEFRNPQQAQLDAKLFTFDPGDATVEDKTQEKINRIAQARSQQQQMQKPQK